VGVSLQILIIIQVITFAGLLVVLRLVFYNQLSGALGRLKRLHEENVGIEEKLKKELELTKGERQMELAKAKEQAATIIKDTKAKAEKLNSELQAQAKQQATDVMEKAKAEIEKAERELALGYQDRSIDLAVKMIQFMFSEQGKEALQHQLISETIAEIKTLEAERFNQKTEEVKVSSAYPLTKEEKENLAKVLSAKFGAAVKLQESQNKDIIVGLVIKTGTLIIDSSLKNKLKKIIPYLKVEYANPG
jgi:F0F1-type ATP synthase delta subunit